MVAALQPNAAAASQVQWKPDPDLIDHFGHRARHLTDEELQTEIAHIDHIFWMAVEAEIEHSTQYLTELASERAAYEQVLAIRARHGYQYRLPVPRNFSRHTIDMLKASVSIEDEIGRALKLVRRGKNYVARCPFHQPDRTPSFTVFPETQSYFCFGCRAHGDVLTWLMDTREVSFPTAVRQLAARCGLEIDDHAADASRSSPAGQATGPTTIPASQRGTLGREGIDVMSVISRLLEL